MHAPEVSPPMAIGPGQQAWRVPPSPTSSAARCRISGSATGVLRTLFDQPLLQYLTARWPDALHRRFAT
jgi:hypothetical protein